MAFNPRRSFKTEASPTSLSLQPSSHHHARHPLRDLDVNLSLKKSSTFHASKSPPSSDDPIIHIPSLSRRSPTSLKGLEDAVAASKSRVASLLSHVDRSLSGLEAFSTDSQETLRAADDSPVPRFLLDAHVVAPDRMDIDSPSPAKLVERRKHHSSDSGIGSTVTASEDLEHDEQVALDGYKHSIPSLIKDIQSGINGSSVAAASNGNHSALSAYACRQIQKHLIVPILKEDKLKDFHSLVKGIPVRVGRKEITCLRDLEKVLLWLAPRFSISRSSFVRFGETTIQALHTVVPHLGESDLRRPADRPYTNGYFLDLTQQVRQYASMITAARERMAAGHSEGDDPTSEDRLVLHGGFHENGRPAELARSKDGKLISMRTGEPIDKEATPPVAEDEDYELSMARRRKNAPEKVVHRCAECDKEFKRPCDLTKHEKTHSRPWKCDEPTCKYSHYGWPTEKERDRHVNDKHSVTPSMYKCQYHPCPYESKRESNCKQHMEKAHGWAYVRSKNNGKTGSKVSKGSGMSPPTPQVTPGSNIFEAGSDFGSPASPYARTHSRTTSRATGSMSESPFLSMDNNFNAPIGNFNWNQQLTPVSPYTPASQRLSVDAGSVGTANGFNSSSFGATDEIDPPLFNGTFDWANMDMNSMDFGADFTTMNMQLITPATSIGTYDNRRHPSSSLDQSLHDLEFSPTAEDGVMLYSPYEQQAAKDEGYAEFATTELGKPSADFALFDSPPTAGMSQQGSMSLFADLPTFQASTWAPQPTDQQWQLDSLMEQ